VSFKTVAAQPPQDDNRSGPAQKFVMLRNEAPAERREERTPYSAAILAASPGVQRRRGVGIIVVGRAGG
jgi:hypothetical protein